MTASSSSKPAELMRRFAPVALAAVLSITATACQTTSPTETTGSFAMASPPPGEADWRRSADAWGERYRADPAHGLVERSRAPHHPANGLSWEVVEKILAMRGRPVARAMKSNSREGEPSPNRVSATRRCAAA